MEKSCDCPTNWKSYYVVIDELGLGVIFISVFSVPSPGLQTQQSLNFCFLSKGWDWGWGDNSAVQATCCYCKGPWFSSQLTVAHWNQDIQSPLWPLWHTCGTHTYMQNTHAHKTKINKSFFKAWGFDACFETTSHVAQCQICGVSEGSFELLILLPLSAEVQAWTTMLSFMQFLI